MLEVTLVEIIKDNKLKFENMNIDSQIIRENNHLNKGLFIERYVQDWLINIPELNFGTSIPEKKGKFNFQREGNSIKAYKNGSILKFEFDGDIIYNNQKSLIEIKSNRLNGFSKKIPKYLTFQEFLFEEENGPFLIFLPIYRNSNKFESINYFKTKYEDKIEFIDLGYTQRQLQTQVKKLGFEGIY